MSDDIVARLRAWSENAKEQGVGVVVDGLQAAADEIERLRAERDEARRWVCQLLASPESVMHLAKPGNGTKRDFAAEQGWDCFKENTDG